MPLVVPVLRLAMLFLNIYDSYKNLKPPPPSARNGGHPSQRAISQRKRDIKGCLAVWIVWCCFVTYERLAEAIIGLFIPFYDELKSLVLLFLIFTRARGAEPIFLHVIRPLLKPYTPTLDIFLDFTCMLGDILFALSTLPIRAALNWWQKSIFYNEETLDSEAEIPRGQVANGDKMDLDAAGARSKISSLRGSNALKFPRKVSSDPRPPQGISQHGRQIQHNQSQSRVSSNGLTNGSQSHQIWHPPASSYSDDDRPDDTITGRSRTRPSVQDIFNLPAETEGETPKREQTDEWRQYPPFPSAYPPTPLVPSSSKLSSDSVTGSHITQESIDASISPDILEEDPSQQDFRGSLLPPRKPLNPGFVSDLSDECYNPGAQKNHFDNSTVDIDIDSGTDEDEDIFNTTLQTPYPLVKISQSHLHIAATLNRRSSTASSVASRSTALTTADNGSSLRTQSSSESLSPASVSLSELSSVLGRKRPLSRTKAVSVKDVFMEKVTKDSLDADPLVRPPMPPPRRNTPRRRRELGSKESVAHDVASTSDDMEGESGEISPYVKRRKVATTTPRAVKSARPVRPRVTRHATVPSKSQVKSSDIPSALSRTSSRLRPGLMAAPLASAHSNDSSQSGSSSANDLPLNYRTRPTGKNPTKKK